MHGRGVAAHEGRDRLVDAALPRDAVLALELRGHDLDLEVAAAAADLDLVARERGLQCLAELVERLRRDLEAWAESADPLPSRFDPSQQEETIRRLRSLGYIN